MLNLEIIAIILFVRQQSTISSTGEILLESSVTLGIDVACLTSVKVPIP